jgi:hypothetical protein
VETISIGLDSWIIEDGNCADFAVGHEYRFALEFYARRLKIAADPAKYLLLLASSDYRFAGEVLVTKPGVTVLDVGFLCYHDGKIPLSVKPGDFVTGVLYMGVDPFFWSETHAREKGMPALFYRWRVRRILLETTPWIESQDDAERPQVVRADQARTFEEVQRTGTRRDDVRGAHYGLHYVLDCELLEQINSCDSAGG